ncbi:MAG: BamA/TamA family outer membrane protein [Fibrobacteres bacterium]|nr:BamA/TamA family outer membrane protein [Fibrobacterota bacterium]
MKAFAFSIALALGAAAVHADVKISFQGNSGLGKRKLTEVINPEPAEYDKEGLQSWREDAEFYLLDLYRSYGYFDAAVRTDLSPRGKDPKDWDAVFAIQEGPRYVYDTVSVLGARLRQSGEPRLPSTRDSAAGPTATLTRSATDSGPAPVPLNPRPPTPDTGTVPLIGPAIDTSQLEARPGKPFRQDALLTDRRYLLRRYGDAGFVRVEADDRIDIRKATKSVKVDYLIDPGEPVIFDTLEIRDMRAPPQDTLQGLTREALIRGLVPYARGDTMRMSSNDKLVEKLQYTGGFNFVRVKDSLRSGAEGRSTMYLYAEEHVPGSLRSSVFYETQYGPGFSVDGRHSNIAGTLNELRSGLSFAYERQTLYAGFGAPLIMGTLVRFDEDVDLNWYQGQDSVHVNQGPFGGDFDWTNSSRLTWPYSYWLRLVTDAELEAKSRMITVGRERDLSLNFIQTAFATFVDQPMDPTRGVRLAFTWGNGGALQRNDVFRFAQYRHNWIEAKTSHYYPLPGLRMLKPATRLDAGRFFGQGGPNSDRFFLGGSRSVRSYGFQNLCPMGPDEKVCVAQDSILAYVQTGAELRVEPFWFLNPRGHWHSLSPLQIVPFLDFGKVWDVRHATHFTWKGSKPPSGEGYASGLGVRYPLLGIFNLRMDFVLKGSGSHYFWLDLAQAF